MILFLSARVDGMLACVALTHLTVRSCGILAGGFSSLCNDTESITIGTVPVKIPTKPRVVVATLALLTG